MVPSNYFKPYMDTHFAMNFLTELFAFVWICLFEFELVTSIGSIPLMEIIVVKKNLFVLQFYSSALPHPQVLRL